MKKIIFASLFILTSITASFSGNGGGSENKNKENSNSKIITGKVVDINSREEIAGAEIIVAGKKIYTDFSGNFTVVISTQDTEATVKYISYIDSKIKIDPFSYSSLIVEITPQ